MRSDKLGSQLDRKSKICFLFTFLNVYVSWIEWRKILILYLSSTKFRHFSDQNEPKVEHHENEFWQLSNIKMNITNNYNLKSRWKKWGHLSSFHVSFSFFFYLGFLLPTFSSSWNSKQRVEILKVTSFNPRFTSSNPRFTSSDPRVQIHELRVQIHDLRVQIH